MEVKPGYKQTEVGVIPEEWRMESLGTICDVRDGTHESPRFLDTGVPFVTSKNIVNGQLDLENVSYISPSDAIEFDKRSKVDWNDILMSMIGTIGSAVLINFEPTFCIKNVALLKPRKVTPPFLIQLINSPVFQRYLGVNLDGGIQKFVSLGTLRQLAIPVPDPPEQRAIAEALSDVDGLLGGLDRLIAKKRDLKQAAMQQLLTGQTRLPGFHGEWENMQVQDVIADSFCGPSPTCEERNIQDESEWGVLKTTAATKDNGWEWTKHKTLPRVFWNKQHIELKKGDVIVTKAGPRHRVGVTAWIDYVPPRIIPSGKMIALRPNPKKVVPLMLAAAIAARDAQTYLDQRTTGMAESQVNFENIALLEAPITIPRIEEQTAIAEVLTEMDMELAALEQRREKTRALKQAMMQELLTGKTRLV